MLIESKVMRRRKTGKYLAGLFRRPAFDYLPHSDKRIVSEVMKERLSSIKVFEGPQSDSRRLCRNGCGRNKARARLKISRCIRIGKCDGSPLLEKLFID